MFKGGTKKILCFIILVITLTSGDRSPELNHAFLDFRHQSSGIRPPCPWTSIVTISGSKNDLGSEIWEYATVYSVARYTGLDPYIPPVLRVQLGRVFKNLQISSFENFLECEFSHTKFVTTLGEWKNMSQSINLPMKTIEIDLIIKYIDDIVQQFLLREKLIVGAKKVLKNALKELNITTTDCLVGIHVNLLDFHEKSDHLMEFYTKAMQSFQDKHKNGASFLVLCGSSAKCKNHFHRLPNVSVETTDNVPAVQLAILTVCDHVILDSDSIGVWGAILAEGETIFNTQTAVTYKLMQNLAKWQTVSAI